uniref:Uncharacterized protein n=1 Tax=Glossina brevipalpis TaxID=37001 RepID=A0A1A9WM66_9MUSC
MSTLQSSSLLMEFIVKMQCARQNTDITRYNNFVTHLVGKATKINEVQKIPDEICNRLRTANSFIKSTSHDSENCTQQQKRLRRRHFILIWFMLFVMVIAIIAVIDVVVILLLFNVVYGVIKQI